MKVKLVKGWFGPDGARYRPGEHQFPQAWKDKLPSSAVVIADEEPAAVEPTKAGSKAKSED